MRHRPSFRPSYALVVSVLAVVVATSGSAWAALKTSSARTKQLSSANIRDNSLTGADILNGSLKSINVSADAQKQLKIKGDEGPKGDTGPTGDTGNTGAVGDQGEPARNAYAWSYKTENSLLKLNPASNFPPLHWWRAGMAGTGDSWQRPDGSWNSMALELADGTNDGLLDLEWESDVVAIADMTAWHEDGTEPDQSAPEYDDGSTSDGVHSRLECRLRIINIATNTPEIIGQPILLSTKEFRHVTNFALIGGIRRQPGTYSVRVDCRDLDFYTPGYKQWFVVKGNLSVLSARNWR